MAKRRTYVPFNLNKYNGSHPIILKSNWEEMFASIGCDMNPACLEWSYEPFKIPYRDPTADPFKYPEGKQTIYIPDFLITYVTDEGRIRTSLVEIKPLKEAKLSESRDAADMIQNFRNQAKWEAAQRFCERRGNVEFVVLTEADIPFEAETTKPKRRRNYGKRRIKK